MMVLVSDAFLIAETMRAVGFVPTMTTYKALTLAAANAGDVPRVRAIIQEMEGEGLKLDPVCLETFTSFHFFISHSYCG